MDPLSTAEGDNMEDDGSELVLPPGVHDIVKHPKHGGECRKCGAVGCWDEIKSKPCPQSLGKEIVATPVHEPSASKTPDLKTESLGEMLDLALKNGDETTAWDIVNKMEAKEAQQSLEDQQLMLEIMEQELELVEAEEQLELLKQLEEEEAQLEQAIHLSKQPLEKVDQKPLRPPATPCTSSTVPSIPVVCFLAFPTESTMFNLVWHPVLKIRLEPDKY